MSKRVGATIQCSECEQKFGVQLYRSLWIEYPENMAMLMRREVNCFACPACESRAEVAYAVLCTHADKHYAVWYEPSFDHGVDADVADYTRKLGPNNYLAEAPRIADWGDFIETIRKYEVGELHGTPISPAQFAAALQGMRHRAPPSTRLGLVDRLLMLLGVRRG